MKNHRTTAAPALLALAALTALVASASAVWAVPTSLSVQGRLSTPGGAPVADGAYNLTFRLYPTIAAQNAVWQEIHVDVPVTAGMFAVNLGSQTIPAGVPTEFFTLNAAPAIGVQVSTDPELPRTAFAVVPYAVHAATADTLAGGLTGDKIVAGTIPPTALVPGTLAAESISFQSGGQATNVQDGLYPLYDTLKVQGGKVGLGKAPANACIFDMTGGQGTPCIDGAPAYWTRVANSDGEMTALPDDGQMVYRKDTEKVFIRVGGNWREVKLSAWCGDGQVEEDEKCDDGQANANAPDACRPDCTLPMCGDSIIDPNQGETCDDGNEVSTDGCIACKVATCGDGFVQDGVEACDDGQANANAPDACRPDCSLPFCGDGVVDPADGEECDDGNNVPGDDCDAQCKAEYAFGEYAKLVGNPDPSTVFSSVDQTYYYANNLVTSLWHKESNTLFAGHYNYKGYYKHTAGQSGYSNLPNQDTGVFYGRMVLVPKPRRVFRTNQGYYPAKQGEIFIGVMDKNTGAMSGWQPLVFGDGFSGDCNLLSTSATELLCYQGGTTIRHYEVPTTGATVNFSKTVTLSKTPNEQCGDNCYMGTFGFDGAYYYFTNDNSSSNTVYEAWQANGSHVGSYNVSNVGLKLSGCYFDWSVGRYTTHHGWGAVPSAGAKYVCSGCPQGDDSQSYSPVSSNHTF